MKKCRICNNKISPTAKPCPKCGEKEPFKSQKYFVIVGLLAISIGIIAMFYFRSL